jgi:hypothetical protein
MSAMKRIESGKVPVLRNAPSILSNARDVCRWSVIGESELHIKTLFGRGTGTADLNRQHEVFALGRDELDHVAQEHRNACVDQDTRGQSTK